MIEDADEEDETAQEARLAARKHVQSVYKKRFGRPGGYADKQKDYDAATQHTWVPLETGDGDETILAKLRAPFPVKTIKDKKSGHYTCTHVGIHQKARSWTRIRTPKAALQLILQDSWQVSIRKLGICPPAALWQEIERIPNMDIPGLNREGEEFEEE